MKRITRWGFCIIVLFGALVVVLSFLFPLPPLKPYSTVIYDRNGEFLHAFVASDGIWRIKSSADDIPERLKTILVQREDRWFYYHPGINPLALARALVQNMAAGKRISGASTITMQIARMLEPKERTYRAKVVEMFRALQLEMKYSKQELLDIYLSMVPLGGNVEGMESAAMIYYRTPLERLNIAQLFDLILIPRDPNNLRPDRHPERLLAERRSQAARWIADGILTKQDSLVIWGTAAAVERQQLPRHAPHFALRVLEKFPQTEVTSSLDLRIQRKVEMLLSSHFRLWQQKGVQNGAVVVVKNATREIVAYLGSHDFHDVPSHGQVDAVKALRSPGSTLKPFLYAMQMERGNLTPRSRLIDAPYDAEGFPAENYDGMYSGLVYADEALRRSLNVPMVRMLKDVGIPAFIQFLANAGFVSLEAQQGKLGLSLILGGCGVTLEELTAAYASFPGKGKFVPLHYRRIDTTSSSNVREVCSPSSAWMVTEILSGLDRPDLPTNIESAVNLPKVAFKTGTSYGRRDAWSIGFTSEYTVGVWLGNVTNKGNPELVGSKAAAPLLVDILNAVSRPGQKQISDIPRDIWIRSVCAKSGLVPTPECQHVVDDYYSRRTSSAGTCDVCKAYFVSKDGKTSYCASCLNTTTYHTVIYESYPPELLNLWDRIGVRYRTPPPHNAQCTRTFAGAGPAILSPSENMTYFVTSPQQRLAFQATSPVDVRQHNWYINERYLGNSRNNEKMFVPLKEGNHVITCVDDKGRISSVRVVVKYVM